MLVPAGRPSAGRPPAVLILMATRNGARFLPEQLDSIAAQEGCDWALHVGDDGSRDATRALVADFAARQTAHHMARHPGRDIRLHAGPGRGMAANFLTLLARPDLPLGPHTHVAFADQDDIWLPDRLARGFRLLGGTGTVPAICAATSLPVDARGRVGRRPPPSRGPVTLAQTMVQNRFPGHALLLNPAAVALARAAGVPEVPFHDWWLALLVLACGGQALCDAAPGLHYRQHRGNLLGARGTPAGILRRVRKVAGGDWGRWIAANRTALEAAAARGLPLTDAARQLLAALATAPPRGHARAATFARLGIHRAHRGEDMLLRLALRAGLV